MLKLSRGERRHIRQQEQAREFLEQMTDVEIIFQVGLGDWAEGPALYDCFPLAKFFAVEPLVRFHDQARERGFEGLVGSFAVWDEDGQSMKMGDRRTKTSVFCQDFRSRSEGVVEVVSITLDTLQKIWYVPVGRTLLWLDCEGAELHALRGASIFLRQVQYVVCELREKPEFLGWAAKRDIVEHLDTCGFDYADHVARDGFFVRR